MANEKACKTTFDVNLTISKWDWKIFCNFVCDYFNTPQSVNVVAEVAEFLQTFTKNISPENYKQIKEVLQALIEVCVGNADNQQVVLDKQVVEPINRILQLGKLHAGQVI